MIVLKQILDQLHELSQDMHRDIRWVPEVVDAILNKAVLDQLLWAELQFQLFISVLEVLQKVKYFVDVF